MPSQARSRAPVDDLGELAADVVEVARVEPDVVALAMELGPDPVVLVLDPDRRARAASMISAASSAGDASMNLSGWKRARLASAEAVVAGEHGGPPDVAGEHAGPLHRVERPVERLRDRRLDEALAQPDPELAREDLDDVLRGQRVGAGEEARGGSPLLAAGPDAASIAANAAATSGSVGDDRRVRRRGRRAVRTSSTACPRSEKRS